MKRIVAFCIAVVSLNVAVTIVCAGQSQKQTSPRTRQSSSQPSPRLFEIGLSEQELLARMGPPPFRTGAESNTRITAGEYSRLRHMAEPYRPTYRRRTANNEYEIMVLEETDRSRSQLHPTVRVASVRFQLDKTRTVPQVLQELPEAVHLCAQGCNVETSDNDVIAFPRTGDSYFSFIFTDHQIPHDSEDEHHPFEPEKSQVVYIWIMKKSGLIDLERRSIESAIGRASDGCFAYSRADARAEVEKMHDQSAKPNYLIQLSEVETRCKAREAEETQRRVKRPERQR
jgi:hypothetical protein